ncbi:MAG TPA: DUF4410 domain-containing protein [Candidatus Methylacidiphilales bacterium]|nr:DUF4410 domain-containing protein [Candidatus Methylacidiphilales bacterium]
MKIGQFLGAGAVLALAGCASVSVAPVSEVAVEHMPQRVYVEPFSVTGAEFNVDREGTELAEFKTDLQSMMTSAITADLTKRLISADAIKRNQWPHPENAWVIRGKFVRVNQGSRFLRSAIGFGMGATKLETAVEVYDLSERSHRPFLTFSTTGGSNAEPGAITGIATDPLTLGVGLATGSAGGLAHGLTEDTKRTAREITAELSDYMYRIGWIPEDKWIKPKQVSQGSY